MFDPIVILAFPRTGSSMVAGVFKQHDIFTGKCLGITPKIPTGAVENIGMKNILKSDYPLGIDQVKDFKPGFRKKIESLIRNEGYVDGPWMAKHTAVYWKVWGEFKPYYVCVKRDFDSVITSNTISGMSGIYGDDLEKAYNLNLREMDFLNKEYGSPIISSDEVVNGDYTTLINAFDYCGLEFSKEKAESIINPDHWHY